MPTSESIAATLRRIGEETVRCRLPCIGIRCDPATGFFPHAALPEFGASLESGCAIVGMNPGVPMDEELEFYAREGPSYQALEEHFAAKGSKHVYHRRLREFAGAAGFSSVVWSEVVKCRSVDRNVRLPLQTFRTCSIRFLEQEIAALPADWPVFAAGKDAYEAVAWRLPHRRVFGLSHPTGGRDGGFSEILRRREEIRGWLDSMLPGDCRWWRELAYPH